MSLKIYNTQSQKKEDFTPLTEGEVKMYVCGPTVYDFLHVGNFRGAIFFNFVRNWLEHSGYKVTYLYNYTDVDDKIINRAKEENKQWQEISTKYIKEFEKDYADLHLKPHTKNPTVSDTMDHIIKFIDGLVKKGQAYEVDGDVYFDVQKFDNYGKLSNKDLDEMASGFRIAVDERKKYHADFALWKSAKEDEPSWDSPWGAGRPGWHIECSAMIHLHLGDSIDIHGGGMDLIFPHHENEVAQSEGLTGKTFVKYWMHNNMLEFGQQKMSKSLGNIRTGRSFLEQYNGEILKYMMLSSHYRSTIDFSDEQVARAIGSLAQFYSALALAKNQIGQDLPLAPVNEKFQQSIEEATQSVSDAFNDDFNTSEAFAHFFRILKLFNNLCRTLSGKVTPEQRANSEVFYHWFRHQCEPMALFQENPQEYLILLDDLLLSQKSLKREDIDALVQERSDAREQKNFKLSDEIRDQLKDMGISVMDSLEGSTWEVQK